MILHSWLNLTIHSFEDKGNFSVYDEDCRNFLTPREHAFHETRPVKFLIILHNYANVWTINQSLPDFRLVTSLDSTNDRSIQTLLRESKLLEVIV